MTRKKTRALQIGAAALFLVSLFLPYWYLGMNAPSYPTTTLRVNVNATGLSGDIVEWHRVSRLVGVKVPPDTPELDNYVVVGAMVGLAAFSVAAALRGRKTAILATALTWAVLAGFLALMQYHFYQVGHDLDTTAPLRNFVKGGFTPPAIGTATIGKITSQHYPHVGALVVFAGALMLTASAFPAQVVRGWNWLSRAVRRGMARLAVDGGAGE